VLDNQISVATIDRQQLASGELMIEPVNRAILQ
jgi:hypothetical protein